MPDTADGVDAKRLNDILLIQLDNSSGFPRLTRSVLEELGEQVDTLWRTRSLCAGVITGAEKAFAVGAELVEVSALSPLEALRFSSRGQGVMRKIEQLSKPVVAAIRGHCLGGGLDLALACHMRVAASDAVFGHPGAKLGIITGWGGTQRLPRTLGPGGRARVMELLATGRYFTAAEAHTCGLVSRVVPPELLLPAAIQLARETGRRTAQVRSRTNFERV